MASGYIGKISAVVTANTSDLSKKLSTAGTDFDKFGQRIVKSLNTSSQQAQQSLEKIFTPLQSLERKLRASLDKTLNLNLPVDKIRALVSAAEEINKPLERAAKQFGQLSIEVQSGFFPALQRAQGAALGVNDAIQSTGSISAKSFNQAKVQVDAVTQALSRLSQAQALAGRSLTGGELQFKNPLLFQTLNASAATTQKAGDLSASTLADGSIAKQVQALQQYQQAAVKAQAKLESLDLNPNVKPATVEAQKRRIENLIETARRAQEQLQRTIDIEKNVGAASQFMSTRDPSGRTIEQRLKDISNQSIQEIMRGQQELGRKIANGFLTILTEEQAAADTVVARQQELGRKIGNGFLTIITEEEAAADTVVARQQELGRKIGNGFLTIITEEEAAADSIASRQQELGRKIGNGFLTIITEEEAAADSIASRQQALGRKIGNGFLTIITEEEAAADTLAYRQQELGRKIGNGFLTIITEEEAAADTIVSRQQALGRKIANGFLNILTPAEAAADTFSGRRAIGANDFRRGFGGPGAQGLQFGADQAELRRYTAELGILQQSISRVSAQARGPAVAAFEQYRLAIARAFEAGTIGGEGTQRVLSRLQRQAVAAAAQVSGVSRGGLARSVSRAGDIGRQGFDRFSLAVNQAAFAIDDFFSATGGLEFKLRAVQNNLTQLGFIAGGTTGLIVALAAAVGGQAAIAFAKYIGFVEDAEIAQKRLNAQLQALNAAAEDQTNSVERLAAAYERLAGTASSAFSKVRQEANARRDELAGLAKAQEERRTADAGALDAEILNRRAELAYIREQIKNEADPDKRSVLVQSAANAESGIAFRQSIIRGQGERLARTTTRDELAKILEEAQKAVSGGGGAAARDRLAVAKFAQQFEGDAAARAALKLFQQIRDTLAPLQTRASGVEGSQSISAEIDRQLTQSLQLFESAIEGDVAAVDKLRISVRELGDFSRKTGEAIDRNVLVNAGDRLRKDSDPVSKLLDDIKAINASFEKQIAGAGPEAAAGLRTEQDALVAGLKDQQRRQAAPALFALGAAVENAVLQGPSRAALNAADISTQQGAAELARLIRGDDPAREQNLVELRKQTSELEKLNAKLDAGVAD